MSGRKGTVAPDAIARIDGSYQASRDDGRSRRGSRWSSRDPRLSRMYAMSDHRPDDDVVDFAVGVEDDVCGLGGDRLTGLIYDASAQREGRITRVESLFPAAHNSRMRCNRTPFMAHAGCSFGLVIHIPQVRSHS